MPAPQEATSDGALPSYPSEERSAGGGGSPTVAPTPTVRRWPWIALSVFGFVLAIVPVAGGMFYPAAQARAMIADFAPYMDTARLDGFTADLARLDDVRSATTRIDTALGTAPSRYRQLDQFQQRYPGIDADMTAMIDEIAGARDDYQRMSALQPLDAIPFIPLGFGVVLLATGIWGWRRARVGTRPVGAVIIGVVTAAALIATPFATSMVRDSDAAGPLVSRFDSLLTTQKVRDVQGHFVVLVGAVGEIDSRYLADVRSDTIDPARRTQIASDVAVVSDLSARWQRMSSDFADLIGTMNDNIKNFNGVARLNSRTESLGFGTFAALPWALLGAGGLALVLVGAGAAGNRHRRGTNR